MAKKHRDRRWGAMPEALPSPIIDNHTHIASTVRHAMCMSMESVSKGRGAIPVYSAQEMIRQAQSVGVAHMVDVSCDYPSLMVSPNMAKAYPQAIKAAVAIHPNETVLHGHRGAQGPDGLDIEYSPWHDVSIDEAIARVYEVARDNPADVVAIGETGLDYFRTGEDAHEAQRQAFRDHIAIAKELGLTLQIHDRDAHGDVVDTLLSDEAPENVVFHSYSADEDIAQIARDNGWYLSFSGPITYKANEHLRQALRTIDLDHVLVETDAPYLTPEPYRGRTNASYMMPYTFRVMADILDMSTVELAKKTYENSCKAYALPYKRVE